MAKIKLTKGELKKQRDALGQFRRYLPTLQLKKQQLQMKVFESQKNLNEAQDAQAKCEHDVLQWIAVLADPLTTKVDEKGERIFDIKKYIIPIHIQKQKENIAGVYVLLIEKVEFEECDYDLYTMPLWLDRAIEQLRKLIECAVKVQVIQERIELLKKELRTTTQRVNLFEKVKIPEAQDSIRRITIYLGDQQANAVGISKVAKKKIEQAALVQS